MADIVRDDPDCVSWKYFIKPLKVSDIKEVVSGLKDKEVVFKEAEVMDFEKKHGLVRKEIDRSRIGHSRSKRPRTKVAGQIYIAAASRAKIWIQDQIHHDTLPVTRQEKLNGLKNDKQFQKTIAALPKCPSDKHLMRKLHEAEPGLWKMGKTTHKKYRKKSTYSS
jgi:hypothetical protein